jgi:general secretion pathway protein L
VPSEALQALQLLAPEGKLKVHVAQQLMQGLQQAAAAIPGLADRLELKAMGWHGRIAGFSSSTPDLMQGVQLPQLNRGNWQAWRWPAGLAALALLVNVIGLNAEWLGMKREAKRLSDGMVQSFRAAYPKETVIREPLAQMQQKITAARRLAGQSSADDFIVLTSQFSQAWEGSVVGAGVQGAAISSLEYRDHSLLVKTKAQGMLPVDALRTALASQSLTLNSGADGVLEVKLNRTEK